MKLFLLAPIAAIGLCLSINLHAQTFTKEKFCGKKWYTEKVVAASGKESKPEKDKKDDYIIYNCDGTTTSHSATDNQSAKWTFDPATSVITITYKEFDGKPKHIIKKLDSKHMVIDVIMMGQQVLFTNYLVSR